MSLKEILNRKHVYDPVHAHVPGVNEPYRQKQIEEFYNAGDPPMPKPEPPPEKTLFRLGGFYIKIVEKTRSN